MQESSRIEQLWYTWAPRGMEEIRGFQVYAASSGLMDVNSITFRAINPYMGYDLPIGTNPSAATRDNSPVCLAYIKAGDKHMLLQKNFTGSDSGGRIGTYFIHLLTSLPTNFTARDAIRLWHSSFWQTSIPESTSGFKDPHRYELFPAPSGILNPEPNAERKFLQDEVLEKHLPYIIQAYLSLGKQQQLVIAADDHEIASLIWGLTQCLPSLLQHDLTFSTYEADILKTDMRIVGTCLPALNARRESMNLARVLPTDSYDGPNVTLNCYTGQHSTLSPQSPLLPAYTQFVTDCLLGRAEMQGELQNLLTSAERLRVSSIQQLLFVYKFIDTDNQSKILSLEDITTILENFNLAIEFLCRNNVQEALITLATQNLAWWEERGRLALIKLQEGPVSHSHTALLASIFAALGRKAALVVANAIIDKYQQTLNVSWDILLITAPALADPEPWATLFSLLSAYHPEEISSWQLRMGLIKAWQYATAYIGPEQIRPWLSISWEQLPDFLQLKLLHEWQIIAVTQLLSGSSKLIPSWIVKLLEQGPYQQLFIYVLRQMWESQRTQEQQAAVNFIQTLLKYGYPEKLVLFDLLFNSRNIHVQMVEELLNKAPLNPQEQLILFENHTQTLLSWHPTPTSFLPVVQSMIKLYVEQFTAKTFFNTNAEHILGLLQENSNKLSNELKPRVYRRYLAGQAICFGKQEALSSELLDKQYLNKMGQAIASLYCSSDTQYMNYLCHAMMATVWEEPGTNKEKCLKLLLEGLCTLTERQLSTDLFSSLATYLGGYDIPPRQLLPYIKVALEYTLLYEPRSRDNYLLPLLKALQKQIRESLNIIDEEAINRWPSKIRDLWQEASAKQHLRPQNIKERISGLNPRHLWQRQDSSHIEAVKPDMKGQKSTTADNAESRKSVSESSNLRQEAAQSSQPSQENRSHKLAEQPHQVIYGSNTAGSSLPTKTWSLQRMDIVRINNQKLLQPITKGWITQVCDIKQLYIPFILELINKDLESDLVRNNTAIADILWEEKKELEERQMNDRAHLFSKVQQELVDDSFIQDWLSSLGKDTKKGAESSIAKYLKAIVNEPQQHKQLEKQMTKDGLKNVLLIFLQRYYVLKQKSLSWEAFLLEERGKILPTIAYSGDKWSGSERE